MKLSRRFALSLFVVFLAFSFIAYGSFARREEKSAPSSRVQEVAVDPPANELSGEASVSPGILQAAPSSPNKADSAAKSEKTWPDGQAKEDNQGAVQVTITPVNLNSADGQLTFDVALNTHSVDLSMDLAALSSLTTDAGLTVQASRWDAPRGGHHLRGTLYFPASVDGAPLLREAGQVTLRVIDVDAPERTFVWAR